MVAVRAEGQCLRIEGRSTEPEMHQELLAAVSPFESEMCRLLASRWPGCAVKAFVLVRPEPDALHHEGDDGYPRLVDCEQRARRGEQTIEGAAVPLVLCTSAPPGQSRQLCGGSC